MDYLSRSIDRLFLSPQCNLTIDDCNFDFECWDTSLVLLALTTSGIKKYLPERKRIARWLEQEYNDDSVRDEPWETLWVFSGISGYNDIQAKHDYQDFLKGLDGLKALHLCSNINLPYLLGLGIDFLSFDAYQLEVMPKGYTHDVAEFIRKGGVISWGIVPTDPAVLSKETPETIANLLLGYWEAVSQNSRLSMKQIAEQALVAPAKCCVKKHGIQ
ncbi:hypothetical protein ACFLTZ_05720 [Chloroflexota bacterium]